MPSSFITNSFQQRPHNQFLSILSSDLESTLRDSDHNSHQQQITRLMEACQYNPPISQHKIAEQLSKYIRSNSLIHLPPVFIGLALTPYSTSTLLRARVLDFFKSPRPLLLAIKAFFQIFKTYPILRYLSAEQIESRLNPPKESSMKAQKLQLLQMIVKQLDPNTKIKNIIKTISQPAALYFYDILQQCYQGEIELIGDSRYYYYRVVQTETSFPYTIKKIVENDENDEPKRVWRCDCKSYFKSGMPCWHELKACLQ